jgi:hypothetical protein
MQPDERLALVDRHLSAEMALDLEGVLATLTPNPVYILWDGSRIEGMSNIAGYYTRMFERVFPRMRGMDEPNIWIGDAGVVAEAPVHLTLDDGQTVACPQVSIVPFEGDLIAGERIYVAPAFAEVLDSAFEGWRGES